MMAGKKFRATKKENETPARKKRKTSSRKKTPSTRIPSKKKKSSDSSPQNQEEPSSGIEDEYTPEQKNRFEKMEGIYCNAQILPKHMLEMCRLGDEGHKLLQTAMEKLGLSARAYNRILKVARTIADLGGEENIQSAHIGEAISYRSLDRDGWAG